MQVVNEELKKHFDKTLKKYVTCFSKGMSLQEAQNIPFENDIEKVFSNLLQVYMLKLETISPGSFEIFLNLFLTKESIEKQPTQLSSSNIKDLLLTYSNARLSNLVDEALKLAGLYGKVVLTQQSSHQNFDVIELTHGCYFSDVMSAFALNDSKFFNPKILCIDGFIESVSEIHRILEDASSAKETIFLFVRGLSEEVIHTLKVNYDRKTLNVIPMIVKYDLDSVNLLVDISTVSGGDVITSLKGNLISAIDVNLFPRVDSVNLDSKGILIENQKSNLIVDQHIKNLQFKLLEQENTFSKEKITNRIKSLGSNRVTISLKNDRNFKKNSLMIDRSLRAIKSASTYGVVSYNEKTYPFSSFKAAQYYRCKINELVNSIGSVVVS